jgi:Tfp pilus assembly protein PilN
MSIQQIDFLPPTYLQNRLRKRKMLWHRGAAAVFLLGIIAGTIQQQRTRLALLSRRDQAQQESARMLEQLGKPEPLQEQIRRLDARANLVTYLRVRVPTTRVLAAASNHLPPYVRLTRLELKRESLPAAALTLPKPPTTSGAAKDEAKLPEQLDYEKLNAAAAETAQFVLLDGVAPDDVSIARYLAALQRDGLFADVKLLFTEEHVQFGHRLRQFGLRLKLHAPGSILPPAAPASQAATRPDNLRERSGA